MVNCYGSEQLDDVISILVSDNEKLEIKEIAEYLQFFYDNKPLLLQIKAFCGISKRGKYFIRKRNVKIMNQLANVKM